MTPQDIVAIILAVGVVLVLLSGTNFNLLWMTPEEAVAARESLDNEVTASLWRDILNVILGALAGYIAGKNKND